jgi:hypothetical protein
MQVLVDRALVHLVHLWQSEEDNGGNVDEREK